jgi:hypothetical protein
MVTANKIYGKYRTGNDIFWIKKKWNQQKPELSGDSVEQDSNLVWPNIQIMLKKGVIQCGNKHKLYNSQ